VMQQHSVVFVSNNWYSVGLPEVLNIVESVLPTLAAVGKSKDFSNEAPDNKLLRKSRPVRRMRTPGIYDWNDEGSIQGRGEPNASNLSHAGFDVKCELCCML